MSQPVASPLTLVMPIKSEADYRQLQELIQGLQSLPPEKNPISVALTKIATVHFARFVFIGESHLAVITTYDGDFEKYIDAFINEIGHVFDQLLVHMKESPAVPVSENREAFLDYIVKHDLKCIPPFYSAYPDLKVLDILTMQRQQTT